jgi:Tripartite tricarboxylate transporter TctB family
MRIRSPRDLWAGLLFVGIAALFIALASQYRFGEAHRMGPGYFPIMVGALLAILGAVVAARALLLEGPPLPRFNPRPLLVTLLAVVLFGLTIESLGLAAAIAVLVMVSAFADRDVRPLQSIALAAALIAFSVAAFVWLLGLPLQVWPQNVWPQNVWPR